MDLLHHFITSHDTTDQDILAVQLLGIRMFNGGQRLNDQQRRPPTSLLVGGRTRVGGLLGPTSFSFQKFLV